MKKICVITGTRAEYGLLRNTIRAIEKSDRLALQLIATGSHLSHSHGMTVNEIKKDGVNITYEIDMLLSSESKGAIAASMGVLMTGLSDCLRNLNPDILLVLGDRYEMLAAVSCAVAMNIPIAHIGGGEITEGAIDEQIRHAITKMAHIHFATTEVSAQNIIKMGEEAFRVLNVGAPVCENIKKSEFISIQELETRLSIKTTHPLVVSTYHPVTLSSDSAEEQIQPLLSAVDGFSGTLIFTGANADFGGDAVNAILRAFAAKNENIYFFQSLGSMYLNVCKHADLMLGNSSSGIIEAPCLRLPVVNIGERQKGRLRHENIIDVKNDIESIKRGIHKALYDDDFKKSVSMMNNLYGDGKTSEKIVKVLEDIVIDNRFIFKKLVWEK